MFIGLGLTVCNAQQQFNPSSLFMAGEQGAWYDPSDLSTQFQDSAGTTPVTAVGQPVGLVLDKHLGLARGTNFTTNGDFSSAGAGWTPIASGGGVVTFTGGVGTCTNPGAGTAIIRNTVAFTCAAGSFVEISYVISGFSGTTGFLQIGSTSGTADYANIPVSANGTFSRFITVTTGNLWYQLGNNAAGAGAFAITNISSKVVAGNHLIQATAASRPVLQQDASSFYEFTLDGVDDSEAAITGGGGTSGFFYCAAVRPSSAGAARTLWSDAGANTGYIVRLNAANQLELAAGNGAAYTTIATVATLASGTTYVVTAWHDGVNLNVQVNTGAVASSSFLVATAGTAGFTVGKDNGAATSFYAGNLYSEVYVKNAALTAAKIAAAQRYIGSKAGIVL